MKISQTKEEPPTSFLRRRGFSRSSLLLRATDGADELVRHLHNEGDEAGDNSDCGSHEDEGEHVVLFSLGVASCL